jgi:hypothetical protein
MLATRLKYSTGDSPTAVGIHCVVNSFANVSPGIMSMTMPSWPLFPKTAFFVFSATRRSPVHTRCWPFSSTAYPHVSISRLPQEARILSVSALGFLITFSK